MALLGLGGKGLRERLMRQCGILPPGSIGQTMFDEILPVVLVDDLTRGLILDQFYRPPAAGRTQQAAVAAQNSFSSLQARNGVLTLIERVEWRTGAAAGVTIRVGNTGTPIGTPTKWWRDRRIQGDPTTLVTQGTRAGTTGSLVMNLRGISTAYTSQDLDVILSPEAPTLESTLSIWNQTQNEIFDVNWFFREVLVP